jgi:protein deglycase
MKQVLLLLCKGFEIYEAAAFFDVLGWAGEYSERAPVGAQEHAYAPAGGEGVKVTIAGLKREVAGSFGIRLLADRLLAEVNPAEFDALAIPGGFETYGFYEEAYSAPVAELIRAFHAQQKPIASICVAALPVANSGVLAGRRATTYHLRDGLRRKQLAGFGVTVVDEPIVTDGNVVTSTSPVTAMDVAFGLLARLTGDGNAAMIRWNMGFPA